MRHGHQQARRKEPAGTRHAVKLLLLARVEHPRDADRRMRKHGAILAGPCAGRCERENGAGKSQDGAQMMLACRGTTSVHDSPLPRRTAESPGEKYSARFGAGGREYRCVKCQKVVDKDYRAAECCRWAVHLPIPTSPLRPRIRSLEQGAEISLSPGLDRASALFVTVCPCLATCSHQLPFEGM